MGNVSTWFKTAAANNTGSTPDYPIEGMAPSTVNDCMRENMAAVARWYEDGQGSLITGGTGNTFTLAANNTYSALAKQPFLVFQVDRANTGASTLQVGSLAAKGLRIAGAALESGALVADTVIAVAYNATDDAYDILSATSITTGQLPSTIVYQTRTITAGNGLTGGGDLSANRTLTVGAGTGITVNASNVALDTSNTRNVDHSTVSVSAGNGITGGGTIAATRTLTLGTGGSITATSGNVVTASSHQHAVGAGIARFSTAAGGSITVSTSAPSGTPATNDIWIQREA